MNLTDNQKRDYQKFYKKDGNATFVANRNKSLVDEVIREAELNRKRKAKAYTEQIRERSDAVATFLKAVDRGKVANVDRYFGRKELARLRGEQIIAEIKDAEQKIVKLSDVTSYK